MKATDPKEITIRCPEVPPVARRDLEAAIEKAAALWKGDPAQGGAPLRAALYEGLRPFLK